MLFVCVALVVSAADAPRLVDPEATIVDFEELHFEVRRLDSRILALPERMPLTFGVGALTGFLGGAIASFPAVGLTVLMVQVGPFLIEMIQAVALFALASVGISVGIMLIVMGLRVVKMATVERAELTRRRDVALLKLAEF